MKVKLGYSMGYAGTDTEWLEEIPEEIVKGGKEAIATYLEEMQEQLWHQAIERISCWVNIEED